MYSGSKHCISAGTTFKPQAATKAAMPCLSMRDMADSLTPMRSATLTWDTFARVCKITRSHLRADSLTAADSCGMDNTNSNLSGGAGFGFGGEYFRPDRLQVHQPRLRNFSLHVGLRIYPKPLRHRLRRAVADSRDLRWPAEP